MTESNGADVWLTCAFKQSSTCLQGDGLGGTEELLPGVVQTEEECMELVKSLRPTANGATVSNPQSRATQSLA